MKKTILVSALLILIVTAISGRSNQYSPTTMKNNSSFKSHSSFTFSQEDKVTLGISFKQSHGKIYISSIGNVYNVSKELKIGDRLVSLNGNNFCNIYQLRKYIQRFNPNNSLIIEVERDNNILRFYIIAQKN